MSIQSISFNKKDWNIEDSKKWMKKNIIPLLGNYGGRIKIHKTDNLNHYILGSPMDYEELNSDNMDIDGKEIIITGGVLKSPAEDLQEVYPLRKESSILTSGKVISDEEYDRNLKDKVTIDDICKKDIDNLPQYKNYGNGFKPGDLLYELIRPIKEGGIGFPYPTGSSTYSYNVLA